MSGTSRPGWAAHLQLRYWRDGERTLAHDRHEGPLRVLQRLYPEGPGLCQHVVVHPPGGVVGGDTLALHATLEEGAHALITTPGATRFYRSEGSATARQQSRLDLAVGARLEWLPLETIAYRGVQAENRVTLALAPGAECLGWDVLALGLPAAGLAFDHGRFTQHLEIPGRWIERGLLDGSDAALLDGPTGLAGHRATATLWFATAAGALAPARREALVEAARAVIEAAEAEAAAAGTTPVPAGVTAAHDGLVVARLLAPRVEPLMQLAGRIRAAWRAEAWGMAAVPPRIWAT